MPNPGKQLVEKLKEQGISADNKIYVYGNIRTASNIRIHSRNQFNIISMDTAYRLPLEPNHCLIINILDMKKLNLTGYKLIPGSEELAAVSINKFKNQRLKEEIVKLKQKAEIYIIAIPEL
jgi:hypothetical protein